MAYVQASTANPLGFRPWNSRLGDYHRARFYVPTPNDLLSGLGVEFPNLPGFTTPAFTQRTFPPRPDVAAMQPRIYLPPEASRRGFAPQRSIWVHARGPTIRNPNWPTMHGLGRMAYTPIPHAGSGSGGQIQLPGGVTVQVSQQPPGTFDSISAWLTSNTIISSVPNWVIVGAGILLLARRR